MYPRREHQGWAAHWRERFYGRILASENNPHRGADDALKTNNNFESGGRHGGAPPIRNWKQTIIRNRRKPIAGRCCNGWREAWRM
jgi:hypothetical protein